MLLQGNAMNEFNMNPMSSFQKILEERQRKLDAELAGVEQEDAATLLTHINEVKLQIPDLGAYIQWHVNNMGTVGADGDLPVRQHTIALTLLRLRAWVTKYYDESKLEGSEIHFMRVKLEILKRQLDTLFDRTGLEPWPECEKSLQEYWESF